MQLTHVFLNRVMPAVGVGGQAPIKTIFIGTKCSDAYGGGTIESLTYERSLNSLVIRKGCPFIIKGNGTKPNEKFDYVAVPWDHVEYAYGVGDVQVKGQPQAKATSAQPAVDTVDMQQAANRANLNNPDPPPAKPIPAQPKGK